MAKGNMFLGYGRGSVGDVVFSRTKGQQTARARNRNPNNPNTDGQVLQRARFRSTVKAFKDITAALFKFAFEDKKERESDFNGFMRHNTNLAPLLGPSYNSYAQPLAPFVMSSGSLPITMRPELIDFAGSTGAPWAGNGQFIGWQIVQKEWSSITPNRTVGDVCKFLIESRGFQEGDIITSVVWYGQQQHVYEPTNLENVTEYIRGNTNESDYVEISQFRIDSSDTRRLTEAGVEVGNGAYAPLFMGVSGDTSLGSAALFIGPRVDVENTTSMVSIIVTRETPQGLKASNSSMVLSNKADNIYQWAKTDENFKRFAIRALNAEAKAILQGSLS